MSTETRARSKSPCMLSVTNDDNTNKLIRDLVKKRAIVKGRLTRFSTYLDKLKRDITLPVQAHVDLKLRIQGASSLFSEFNIIQTQLEESVLEIDLDEQLNQREIFEDSYYNILARAECMLGDGETDSSTKKTPSSDIKSVKLPTISIPTFDGSYEHWLEFRDTFQSLIHNSDRIASIQKFHYLKSSLKGSAALVIDSLEFSAANYDVAWELLISRYDNSRLLVHNHVKALFTIQALTKEAPDLLRHLIDTILKNMRALKLLGEPVDSWDTLIIYIVVTKLDKVTEREWEQFKNTTLKVSGDSKSILKVDILLNFLKDRADMLETLHVSHASTSNKKQFTNAQTNHKVHCNVSTDNPHSQSKKVCLVCKQRNHPLYTCQKFLDFDVAARLKVVKDNELCENCLRVGHTVNNCRFGPCRKCERKHNSLIHQDNAVSYDVAPRTAGQNSQPVLTMQPLPTAPSVSTNSDKPKVDTHTNILCANYPCVQPVLLSTALVEVKDRYNNYQTARALLDSGSERCIITQSLCEKLSAQMIQSTHEVRGVGNSISQSTKICDIEVKSRTNPFIMRIQCIVLPHITSTLPAIPEQYAKFGIPDNLQLADPCFHESQNIDILIGADKFWELLGEGRMRLPKGPFLQNTQLGWIVSGPININLKRNRGYTQCNFSQTIEAQLRRFWELEELPKLCDTRSEEEKECEDHFVKTTTRDNDGRFCVNIPLKSSTQSLGETYPQALNRFLSLEKRLQRDPEYKRLYTDFIHEYVSLGHMTRVDSYGTPNFFLPHHGVLREHSTTTKLRVVFNASAASSTGVSLNDLQLVGPPIQGDLLAILLRLRIHKYVACSDVEKMYRQAEVCESQRDLQLILWRDDPTHKIGILRHNRIVYGTAAAAFMACRCLKETAADCTDPDVKRVINEDFFVDDMITTSDDKDQLLDLCEKTYKVLQSGCFPLRKWVFNFDCGDQTSSEIFGSIKPLNLDESSHCKTLGIGWNNVSDVFHYNTQFKNDTKITKRSILSHVSQIFDPYGLLSPTIMVAKVLLQKLWLVKLDWDDTLPYEVVEVWNRFASNLSTLEDIRVPRHVIGSEPSYIELHIFTDASQTAYGSCAYIRTVSDKTRSASVRLLCSKGKVAPLKPVSIPRLELCGALLGAQLYSKISESMHCEFKSIVFWTDSTIVLGWLRMAPNLLKTFVQNRVAEIHELTKDLPWRHVSGKENPADLVSRGCPLPELASSELWWKGSPFLRDYTFDCAGLATDTNSCIKPDELPEVKPNALNVLVTKHAVELFPFSRFSQFERMRRSFAYVLRFIHNTRNKSNRKSGVLTFDELRESEFGLVRLSQIESFSDEYKLILKNQSLKKTPCLYKLNLFIDANKIIRVGGRIDYSENFDYDKKHPILLCSKHRFSVLLMRFEHQRLLHAAPQALLYDIRQRWWPVGGRNLARRIVNECVACKRLKGKTLNPIMGNLPKERLSPTYPFLYCGVDYAGPVLTLNRKGRGAKTEKSYICLFVCFVTRAIHLELVSDLSTEAYILALKRFISRRGKPNEIFSDNGKNFVGANNELTKFLNNCSADITEYALSQAVKLRFIPPYTAHFGGLWEAGVKSCKLHLARVIGNAHLTFEELTTVLTQVEAILNSRPLSPLSSDPHDFLPLSPGHFLVGRPLTAPVYQDMRGEPERLLNRFQRVEQIRHNFWTRWAKEYVSELQTRCKWRENVDSLEPNTLVIIKDDKLPPLKWSLGRIISTISGKDGVSRVADIRTSSGTIRRSFAKICPLFREEEEEAKQQED